MNTDPLLAPLPESNQREINGMLMDIVSAGKGRVKRMIYPPGFKWSTHIKPIVSTDLCMHAHVGFLARGHIRFIFRDGCIRDYIAPQVLVVEPEHEALIIGDETAVLIEFDFEGDTVRCFGLPESHRHD